MRLSSIVLGFALSLATTACGPTQPTETEGAPVSAACQDHRDEATRFVEQNRSCKTVLDCVSAEAVCYDGSVSNPCGVVGLSAEADITVWDAIGSDLADSCECGAAECGPALLCNDAQQCESVFGSDAYCPSIERDVQTFLAANRACQSDDDCMELASTCYVDDCSGVVVNVDTNREDWTRLNELLSACAVDGGTVCNLVGDCAFELTCTDEGQCASSR